MATTSGPCASNHASVIWDGVQPFSAAMVSIFATNSRLRAKFSADGLKRLSATLATERDPNHKLLIDNYTPVPVLVTASIVIDERYISSEVLAAAQTRQGRVGLRTCLGPAGALVDLDHHLPPCVHEADDVMTWIDNNFHQPCDLGRAGLPEEIASITAYLASRRNGYVTGATVNVDGGSDFI